MFLSFPGPELSDPAKATIFISNMDPQEEFDANNDDLHKILAKRPPSHCHIPLDQEQQQETMTSKG